MLQPIEPPRAGLHRQQSTLLRNIDRDVFPVDDIYPTERLLARSLIELHRHVGLDQNMNGELATTRASRIDTKPRHQVWEQCHQVEGKHVVDDEPIDFMGCQCIHEWQQFITSGLQTRLHRIVQYHIGIRARGHETRSCRIERLQGLGVNTDVVIALHESFDQNLPVVRALVFEHPYRL